MLNLTLTPRLPIILILTLNLTIKLKHKTKGLITGLAVHWTAKLMVAWWEPLHWQSRAHYECGCPTATGPPQPLGIRVPLAVEQ